MLLCVGSFFSTDPEKMEVWSKYMNGEEQGKRANELNNNWTLIIIKTSNYDHGYMPTVVLITHSVIVIHIVYSIEGSYMPSLVLQMFCSYTVSQSWCTLWLYFALYYVVYTISMSYILYYSFTVHTNTYKHKNTYTIYKYKNTYKYIL